jgi:microcystin-dependent protein
MSFRRHQSFAINTNTYLSGRLHTFTQPHVYYGNLYIENNLTVHNNTDICGNLTVANDINATNFRASGNFYLDGYVLIPAGTIIMSAAVNEPAGWLHCNGRLLNKVTYADLYAAIGNAYSTDISSAIEFKIPDLRGRVGVGSYEYSADSNYTLIQRSLGQQGGEESHILVTSEMPSHSHTVGNTTIQNGLNTRINVDDSANGELNLDGSQTTTSSSVGGGQPHNNMQPFLVVRYLIKY